MSLIRPAFKVRTYSVRVDRSATWVVGLMKNYFGIVFQISVVGETSRALFCRRCTIDETLDVVIRIMYHVLCTVVSGVSHTVRLNELNTM